MQFLDLTCKSTKYLLASQSILTIMSAVTEDLRSLTFNLCEPRDIPALVTDLIAGYLDERDLLQINMLSQDFNLKASASIY